MQPALPPDNLYSNLCVTGQSLNVGVFDPQNAEATVAGIQDRFYLTGNVVGAKPVINTCMPMKNTPLNPLTGYSGDPNYAFAWFMNAGNYNTPSDVAQNLNGIYKNATDSTRKAYTLIGDLFCQSMLQPAFTPANAPSDVQNWAAFHRSEAQNCWDQYIAQRITQPWKLFEPAGSPLTAFLPKTITTMAASSSSSSSVQTAGAPPPPNNGPNPAPPSPNDTATQTLAGLYCQPLMRGDQSQQVYAGKLAFNKAGYAPVISSNNPLTNENEYLFSTFTQDAFYTTLRAGGAPGSWGMVSYYAMATLTSPASYPTPWPVVDLPCIQQKIDNNLPVNAYDFSPHQEPHHPPPPPSPSSTGGSSTSASSSSSSSSSSNSSNNCDNGPKL